MEAFPYDELAKAGIARVVVTYYGSGDEGSIDEVYQGLQFVVRLKDRPERTAERLS